MTEYEAEHWAQNAQDELDHTYLTSNMSEEVYEDKCRRISDHAKLLMKGRSK